MRNTGSLAATSLRLLAVAALVAAASAAAVKTAASSAEASSSEEEPSGGRMYMVPHLGNNPVLGPVTGAPPGKLVHVPLSAPSVSVRQKDDSVSQRRLPEKRSLPHWDRDDYHGERLRRPRQRNQQFGLGLH